ncbi:MAG TPA: amino acid ABC transporter substrate-binding protein [Xanthobacteraceae bacterium]|nr:amino acid ABC transporter substrate-binding protein [Xanthobacteraceae bacterium]
MTRLHRYAAALLFVLCAALPTASSPARAQTPIKIGFSMALTGGLSPNGKPALIAMKIWEEDVNARGGLLGRPVQLVYYDDQSNPANVPGIYTKLLDLDKVDLVVGPYATNMVAPAMPVIIQRNMVFTGLYGFDVNSEFHYPRYFSFMPTGSDSRKALSQGFFDVARSIDPKPKTVAIVAADAEFARNAADGGRANAQAAGLKIVYDRTYPPSTVDFTTILRAIQAADADILYVASYPIDTVGMVRAAREIGVKAKQFGGSMVGLQTTSIKTQLGPLLNGIVTFDFWLPAPSMQFPGVLDLLKKYQEKAVGQGVDPLGYVMAPTAYAQMQVIAEAVEGTKSLEAGKLADYIHGHVFATVAGDIGFTEFGEWATPRILTVQFQHVKGNGLDQFKDTSVEVIVAPETYKSGTAVLPWVDGR